MVRRGIWHSVWVEQAAGIGARSEGATCRRWYGGAVHVHAGVLLLPFGPAILKPNFHLPKREVIKRNLL